MIHVHVCAEHAIDLRWIKASGAEAIKKPRLQPMPVRKVPPILAVPDTGIDDDRLRRRFNDKALDHALEVTVFRRKVRHQPADLLDQRALRPPDDLVEIREILLVDAGDFGLADHPRHHAPISCAGARGVPAFPAHAPRSGEAPRRRRSSRSCHRYQSPASSSPAWHASCWR